MIFGVSVFGKVESLLITRIWWFRQAEDSLLMVAAFGLKPRSPGATDRPNVLSTSLVWMKRSDPESSRFCGVNTS
jgi:hypothetical protein